MEHQPRIFAPERLTLPWPFVIAPEAAARWHPLLLECRTPTHSPFFEGEGWECTRTFTERSMSTRLTPATPSFALGAEEPAVVIKQESQRLVRNLEFAGFETTSTENNESTESKGTTATVVLVSGPEEDARISGSLALKNAMNWTLRAPISVNMRSYIEDIYVTIEGRNVAYIDAFSVLRYASPDEYVRNRAVAL